MHELGIRFLINAYDQYSLQWNCFMFAWMAQSMCESLPSVGHTTWRHAESVSICFNDLDTVKGGLQYDEFPTSSDNFLDCISGGKLPAKHGISQTAWLVDPTCTCADVLLSIVLVSLSAREGFCVCFAGICAGHCGLDYYVRFFLMIWLL